MQAWFLTHARILLFCHSGGGRNPGLVPGFHWGDGLENFFRPVTFLLFSHLIKQGVYFRTYALILSSFPIGEFDFLVRALSGEEGLLSLKLRGARRPRARLKFLKEPGIFADLHLYGKPEQAKPVQMLTGTILESFEGARERLENFHLAADILKFTMDFATPFDSKAPEKLCLILETLARLAMDGDGAHGVLIYKLKMLEMSGWKLSASELALTGFDPAAVALCERLEQGGRPLAREAAAFGKLERMLALHADRILEGRSARGATREVSYV